MLYKRNIRAFFSSLKVAHSASFAVLYLGDVFIRKVSMFAILLKVKSLQVKISGVRCSTDPLLLQLSQLTSCAWGML